LVAEASTSVDVTAGVIAWVKAVLPATFGTRVFSGYNSAAAQPQVVVQRIAGPDDACYIQFDVWAVGRSEAALAAAQLATMVSALARFVSGNVLLKDATVESIRWLPDPESDTPRYIVEVTFTASHKP
jgi:hypothetical protein